MSLFNAFFKTKPRAREIVMVLSDLIEQRINRRRACESYNKKLFCLYFLTFINSTGTVPGKIQHVQCICLDKLETVPGGCISLIDYLLALYFNGFLPYIDKSHISGNTMENTPRESLRCFGYFSCCLNYPLKGPSHQVRSA